MTPEHGTDNILALAEDLRRTAPAVRSFASHSKAAALMEKAAAALTRAVDIDYEQLYREASDQLDVAQAREAKLREALELIYNGSTPAKAIARFALKAHTDDSALQERLKAAKVEVLREAADVLSRSADVELYEPVLRRMADELEQADAIRGLA
jgi:vacuolar-type H+-ATPase subunit I/STV1